MRGYKKGTARRSYLISPALLNLNSCSVALVAGRHGDRCGFRSTPLSPAIGRRRGQGGRGGSFGHGGRPKLAARGVGGELDEFMGASGGQLGGRRASAGGLGAKTMTYGNSTIFTENRLNRRLQRLLRHLQPTKLGLIHLFDPILKYVQIYARGSVRMLPPPFALPMARRDEGRPMLQPLALGEDRRACLSPGRHLWLH